MENIVEKLRKDKGLNQEELARILKVSRQTISAIENGKYNPSLELAFSISEFFGLRIEEIFFPSRGGKENEKE
ncbi:MAG: helix-turn-helix transcriptional regulator [Peptococcaceae bacterium]|nr:helix-turn-helix transcriptional regulator [Peptococcaceae bacterium]